MGTVIKGDITTMRNNLIREKEEQKKKREEERAIIHNTRTDSTLYNTKQWKKLRNYYIMNHPLCENCSKYGLNKGNYYWMKIILWHFVHHVTSYYIKKEYHMTVY